MKFCPNCGSPVSDNDTFCLSCGSDIEQPQKAAETMDAAQSAPASGGEFDMGSWDESFVEDPQPLEQPAKVSSWAQPEQSAPNSLWTQQKQQVPQQPMPPQLPVQPKQAPQWSQAPVPPQPPMQPNPAPQWSQQANGYNQPAPARSGHGVFYYIAWIFGIIIGFFLLLALGFFVYGMYLGITSVTAG